MNPFDESPDEPSSVSSPLRIFLNRIFIGSALVFYLLGAAWGLGWLK
jgi:hypothetical protein